MKNKLRGDGAEERAAQYLEGCGYRILQRNVRIPGGEIDLVAMDGQTVVFVEVKARSGRSFGSAIGAVNARKQKTLRAIAADYLQFIAPNAPARFDVVTVEGERLTLVRNAFS